MKKKIKRFIFNWLFLEDVNQIQRIHYNSTSRSSGEADYFLGMYNGMECIKSCLSGEELKYK